MSTNPSLQQAMNAIRSKRFVEACSILLGILAATPGNLQARWILIQTLEHLGKTDDTLNQLKLFLIHVKNDLPAIDQIADHLLQRHYPLKYALQAYKRFLSNQPRSANAAYNYAYYLGKDGQFEAAITMYGRALELGINDPEEVHLNIANIYTDHFRNNEEARSHLKQALANKPDYASAFYNLGNLSEQDGKREEAARYFDQCLEIEPDNEAALARLAETQNFVDKENPLLQRLVKVAKSSSNSDINFALGKACEQLADFETAWTNFSIGNERDGQAFPLYDPVFTEAFFERIKSICSRQWLAQFKGTSHRPVFICGMFRTGSTLLEQVLAAHPVFVAGGERDFIPRLVAKEFPGYPNGLHNIPVEKRRSWKDEHRKLSEKLAGGAIRLTDKRPDNFLYIGLIKAIIPSAKFVVTERDWRDVATSIFCTRLAHSQNYATSLKNTRHYIQLQKELVDHWQSVLGADLIRIRYEDLVSQPREIISGLLADLGEAWDERCLSFDKLKNTVQTASVWQVRQPFHTKSIGRWMHYQQYFENAFGSDVNS